MVILLLAPAICFGQEAKKIPVAVEYSEDDEAERRIAFDLKEAIRASQSFVLVDNGWPTKARVTVHIVASGIKMTNNVNTLNTASIALAEGITYNSPTLARGTRGGVLLFLGIRHCEQPQFALCAKEILPDIARAVDTLRRDSPTLWQTL